MNDLTAFSPAASTSTQGFISQIAYIIIIILGALVVLLTITVACYLFRSHLLSTPSASDLSRQIASPISAAGAATAPGLEEGILRTYPKMPYSELNPKSGSDSTAGSPCCSICLADYKDDDMIMLLPDCAHFFHLSCVNQWLRAHPTCPVCRNSPIRVVPDLLPIREVSQRPSFVSHDHVV